MGVCDRYPSFFCIYIISFACAFSSFFFCSNKRKTKQKENSPSAFFYLLQHFSPLNKKNSLRSNSFLFLTLQKALPLHGKKKRTDLYPFLAWCLTLLRSLWGYLLLKYVLEILRFALNDITRVSTIISFPKHILINIHQ